MAGWTEMDSFGTETRVPRNVQPRARAAKRAQLRPTQFDAADIGTAEAKPKTGKGCRRSSFINRLLSRGFSFDTSSR